MKEQMDFIPELGSQAKLEKLEPGIFREVIHRERIVEDREQEAFVYGNLSPEASAWELFPEELGGDSLSWKEMEDLLGEFGPVESHREMELSTLADMLGEGETVFCLVNDFALEREGAETLPGLSGNTLLWISGLDLREYDSATVCSARSGGQVMYLPLDRFMNAWRLGRGRALSLQTEG